MDQKPYKRLLSGIASDATAGCVGTPQPGLKIEATKMSFSAKTGVTVSGTITHDYARESGVNEFGLGRHGTEVKTLRLIFSYRPEFHNRPAQIQAARWLSRNFYSAQVSWEATGNHRREAFKFGNAVEAEIIEDYNRQLEAVRDMSEHGERREQEWANGTRGASLRKATIKLAHANPELRPYLLPLLASAGKDDHMTSSTKTLAEWQANIEAISPDELWAKAKAANTLAFLEQLVAGGLTSAEAEGVMVAFAARHRALGITPALGGYLPLATL